MERKSLLVNGVGRRFRETSGNSRKDTGLIVIAGKISSLKDWLSHVDLYNVFGGAGFEGN